MKKQSIRRKYVVWIAAAAIILSIVWLLWPVGKLFQDNYSRLIFDKDGNLLRAFLAQDEQFRFPFLSEKIPEKYVKALLTFEDRRFFRHHGVDPIALSGAAFANLSAGKRLRGGSTISMQVIRLSHPRARTIITKVIEIFCALKLELHCGKSEILDLYTHHVPMGGNVVGIQAASYRYFGKPIHEITWAEAALFAVIPNSPSLINSRENRDRLTLKRNNLLKKMHRLHVIDAMSCNMACEEPLPDLRNKLPFHAPHFIHHADADNQQDTVIHASLDAHIQQQAESLVHYQHIVLANQGIRNIAVMVAETATGKIRAYVGSQSYYDSLYGGQVDGVQAYRSTGSLLKPLLVVKALDRGPYTMASKIQDVPTYYGSFAPQNASKNFYGLVSLATLLLESLNVPAVRLLNSYGVQDFYDDLLRAEFRGLFRSAEGYGLTLIIGGAEANLMELVQLYCGLGNMGHFRRLTFYENDSKQKRDIRLFSEGSAWLVLNVLNKLARPEAEYYWRQFNNQVPVAWKTGTSYGQKDGWAIGVNKQWTIGVWAGNFDGEGNAALTGAQSAAPLLFMLFNQLTRRDQPMWFEEPVHDLKEIACCSQSGYAAGPYCPQTSFYKRPACSYTPGMCPFHRRYLIDRKSNKSVCSLCWAHADTTWVTRYIVPPDVKEILTKRGQKMDSIPLHSSSCPTFSEAHRLEIIYPVQDVRIMIPRDYDGTYEKIVFSAKHQQPSIHLFWFLNNHFIGETTNHHEMAVDLRPGAYQLTVQDEEGFSRTVRFEAYRK